MRAPLSPHFTQVSTHQGCFQTELTSCKSWDEEKNPPVSPAHPSSVIPNILSLGLCKAGAPAAALEMERGLGISRARGTHLCRQGLCALGVAWAICLLQSLCQVSSCSQLPGVHLGWGKRALQGCTNPRKCSRMELREARVESKCRPASWQKGSGIKGQGPLGACFLPGCKRRAKVCSDPCVFPRRKEAGLRAGAPGVSRHTGDPGRPSS